MARDMICPACGKFGFKTTEVFVTGESASLKCVLCGEWSAQPKWKTVAMLIAEVGNLEAECKERVAEKMEWLTERNELQSSLTRSKAEGRMEALEAITGARLAEILVQYGVVQAPAVEDAEMYDNGATVGGIYAAAAAIRQQAGEEGKL